MKQRKMIAVISFFFFISRNCVERIRVRFTMIIIRRRVGNEKYLFKNEMVLF